jgi:hypothetical protein
MSNWLHHQALRSDGQTRCHRCHIDDSEKSTIEFYGDRAIGFWCLCPGCTTEFYKFITMQGVTMPTETIVDMSADDVDDAEHHPLCCCHECDPESYWKAENEDGLWYADERQSA